VTTARRGIVGMLWYTVLCTKSYHAVAVVNVPRWAVVRRGLSVVWLGFNAVYTTCLAGNRHADVSVVFYHADHVVHMVWRGTIARVDVVRRGTLPSVYMGL
jgi:hypothetical protein